MPREDLKRPNAIKRKETERSKGGKKWIDRLARASDGRTIGPNRNCSASAQFERISDSKMCEESSAHTFCASLFCAHPFVRAAHAEENNESEWAFNHREFFSLRSSVRALFFFSAYFVFPHFDFKFSGMRRIHLKINAPRMPWRFRFRLLRGSRALALPIYKRACQTISL